MRLQTLATLLFAAACSSGSSSFEEGDFGVTEGAASVNTGTNGTGGAPCIRAGFACTTTFPCCAGYCVADAGVCGEVDGSTSTNGSLGTIGSATISGTGTGTVGNSGTGTATTGSNTLGTSTGTGTSGASSGAAAATSGGSTSGSMCAPLGGSCGAGYPCCADLICDPTGICDPGGDAGGCYDGVGPCTGAEICCPVDEGQCQPCDGGCCAAASYDCVAPTDAGICPSQLFPGA